MGSLHYCAVPRSGIRHAYGTELARVLDGNVVAVGRAMGHSSPQTTMGYIGWNGGDTVERMGHIYDVA